jgi:hypothetical protein
MCPYQDKRRSSCNGAFGARLPAVTNCSEQGSLMPYQPYPLGLLLAERSRAHN